MAPTEAQLDAMRAAMRNVKAASAYDKVCNDECTFSFDTPFSPDGLYVSMGSYQSFGKHKVRLDKERTGNQLYVHLKHTRVPKPEPTEEEKAAAPTKLGIGVAGGFALGEDKYDLVKEQALVLIGATEADDVVVPLPCPELPMMLIDACTALISHKSHLTEAGNAAVAWEVDIKPSKYADGLVQLPPHKKISPDPADWVCEESGMRENLWLNLSDGHIGSGRRQWDGSGGTNGALTHYEVTRTTHPPSGFPLVVKLGTITPQGADVYSYSPDEDSEVSDPKLAEHLAHWGINMMVMEKTEKSVEELNVEANQKLELDKITEAGKELEPLAGPGYVGLQNLGNSCYMNSVLQVLFATPELNAAFEAHGPALERSAPTDASQDLLAQLTKLRDGLHGPRYAQSGESEEAVCVQPRMLKHLVGINHSEFSSARQQDAQEYLQHLLELVGRAERTVGGRLGGAAAAWGGLAPLFSFEQEERIGVDGMVCYKPTKGCTQLLVPVPLEQATNSAEYLAYEERAKRQKTDAPAADAAEEPVVPIVPFEACLAKLLAPASLDNFRGREGALKTTRLTTFPRYLVLTIARYYTSEDWQPKKRAVQVPMPESLDLTAMRARGVQEGETLLPDEAPPAASGGGGAPAALEPDAAIVGQLITMGFSENGCKRAAVATKNAGAEPAMEWYELLGIISHMGSNTSCGHYVCHIKKEGRWCLYNDRKVAVSESPPLDLGYMYVYQRKDGDAMDVA